MMLEVGPVMVMIIIVMAYGMYILTNALPNFLIFNKYNQSHSGLAFVPLVSEYKFYKFAYEGAFRGNPKNELARMVTGLMLLFVTGLAEYGGRLVSILVYDDVEAGLTKTVSSLTELTNAWGNGNMVLVVVFALLIVSKMIIWYGFLNVSEWNFQSISKPLMFIGALLIVVTPQTFSMIIMVAIKYVAALHGDVTPKYEYETPVSKASTVVVEN